MQQDKGLELLDYSGMQMLQPDGSSKSSFIEHSCTYLIDSGKCKFGSEGIELKGRV
jgi:hypothetical protein